MHEPYFNQTVIWQIYINTFAASIWIYHPWKSASNQAYFGCLTNRI